MGTRMLVFFEFIVKIMRVFQKQSIKVYNKEL
ncbi:hypothetical protein NF27_FN00060 [Candidatus Jidaibacter acanthamoeba]|uniref:Uncharacterized protein n=1 Tax=Candidatus Jidaibacter acanthamoebae TaxID=86105 RepID=A0A0C1MRZ5_9RICK|nr:hypothetical protein NF27_FN00060 [Candidatus Jidaibacter acanthamoeba]